MKKMKLGLIGLITVILILTSCNSKEEPISNLKEPNDVVSESNGGETDGDATEVDNTTDEGEPTDETEAEDEEITLPPTKKLTINDFQEISHLPEKQIFGDTVKKPDDFQVKDEVLKLHAGIDWNYASYVCSFQLLIGNNNQAVFSFGNGETADESFLFETEHALKTGYLNLDDKVVLLSVDEENGVLHFEFNDNYGNPLNQYRFEGYQGSAEFQMISSDMTSFYLAYKIDEQICIDTYTYDKNGLSLTKKEKFKKDVMDVYSDENTIFVEWGNDEGHYIDICNKALAVMDRIEIDPGTQVLSFDYVFSPSVSQLFLYIQNAEKLYKAAIPQENKYSQFYSQSVLENQATEYNSTHERHYLVYEDFYVFENGNKVEMVFPGILDDNFGGINYYKIPHGPIVKTNSEHNVCYILEEPYNNVSSFIDIDDYFIGLNNKDEICYVDKAFADRPINDTFIGEKFSYQYTYYNSNKDSVTYFNKDEKAIYTIGNDQTKVLETVIPDDIWEAYKKEDENYPYFKMGCDEHGIGLIGPRKLYYYDRKNSSWHIIEGDYGIRHSSNKGYSYQGYNMLLTFNPKSYSFEPYYFNVPEVYDSLIVEDMLYVNTWYEYGCEDDPYHMLWQSEYVPIETAYGNYKISDYQKTDSHTVIKEYSTNYLISFEESGPVKLLEEPVRLYNVSESGILYSGYEDKSYLYYYDFETGNTKALYEQAYIADLVLRNDYAYFMTISGSKLIRMHLETRIIEEIEVRNSVLDLDASSNCIAIGTEDGESIYIIDLNQFQVIDVIDGADYKWGEDQLFYDCKGYLVKYDPLTQEMHIISNVLYPIVKAIHKNNVYYLWAYDGPSDLAMISVDQTIDFSDENGELKDYYLLNNPTDFYQHLLLYDYNNLRLKSLANADSISYEIDGNTIKYQEKFYDRTGEWQEIIIEEDATIGLDGVEYD